MSKDDKHSDHDLKAYLAGKDGVSAAYRKTARDEPPSALDRAILDAARTEVVKNEPAFGGREIPHMYGPAALAASVMVAVVAATLYFNPQQIVVPVSIPVAGQRAVFDEQRTASAERAETEERQAAGIAAEEFQVRQVAPPAPAVGVANTVTAPTQESLRADALARLQEPPVIVIEGPLLDAIEADAAAAQQAPRESQSEELEEIVVGGSRISRRAVQRDYSYRESREDWLEQIRELKNAYDVAARLTNNASTEERLLQDEVDLYLETYPDADLEAELEDLEE